jgi:DNA repair exonuclease SbcCD ATPase subunit
MITKLTIKNYRSFGVNAGGLPQTIELKPLTFIVGDNSSGKSNILRALEFATTPSVAGMSRTDFFVAVSGDKERKAGEIRIVVESVIGETTTTIECVAKGGPTRRVSRKPSR